MTPKRLALALAGLASTALLCTAGLAVAGVSLPDAARAPFDQVGITLPNQSNADAVQAVIEGTPPSGRGCAFGQEVAAAASNGHSQGQGNPCEQAGEGGTDQNEESATRQNDGEQNGPGSAGAGHDFGQATAADAQENASQDGRAFGERTSDSAQQLGDQQSQAGQETGDQQSQAGQATGEEHSQVGQEQAQAGLEIGQSQAEQGQSIGEGAAQAPGP